MTETTNQDHIYIEGAKDLSESVIPECIPREYRAAYLSFSEAGKKKLEEHYKKARIAPSTLCWGCQNVLCYKGHDCALNYGVTPREGDFLRIAFKDYMEEKTKDGRTRKKAQAIESVIAITCPRFTPMEGYYATREDYYRAMAEVFGVSYNTVLHKPKLYGLAFEEYKIFLAANAKKLRKDPEAEDKKVRVKEKILAHIQEKTLDMKRNK